MKKGVIIQGSSRKNGDTFKIATKIKAETGFDILHLADYNIGHFDYDFSNNEDDFNALFKEITTNYQTIIFATPVYWYTMSGRTKVFLDRISDFLKKELEFGRLLRGKDMVSVSVCNSSEFFKGFEMPFINSADYLGMNYKGHLHTWIENENVTTNVEVTIKAFFNKNITT
jgi:multimeric flavodoxin WrbA